MDNVEHRYMFDTNAINKIAQNSADETSIYLSKSNGYEYYFTDIQCDESGYAIAPRNSFGSKTVKRTDAEYAVKLMKIIAKLQTKHINKIGTLLHNKWILDGTYEVLPSNETQTSKMFFDILKENDGQHYNDAMIAMTAIVNGCTLVSDDKRLFNKVNKHFPGRAIRYAEFMEALRK